MYTYHFDQQQRRLQQLGLRLNHDVLCKIIRRYCMDGSKYYIRLYNLPGRVTLPDGSEGDTIVMVVRECRLVTIMLAKEFKRWPDGQYINLAK